MNPQNPETPMPASPVEARPTVEKETVDKLLNPANARIAAQTVKKSAFDPEVTLKAEDSERFKVWFSHKTPDHMNFQPVEALSVDGRRDYEKQQAEAARAKGEEPKNFEDRKKEWNQETSEWIKQRAEKAPDREEFASTLKALDLDDMENLSTKVDAFYDKYLNKKSDIKGFVGDLAKDLKDDQGNVDLGRLETRLNAAKGLFSAFGTKDDVHKLVKDYAMDYGLLSQNEPTKRVVAEAVLPHVTNPVTDDEAKLRLQALHRKNEELKSQATEPQAGTAQSEVNPSQPQAETLPAPPSESAGEAEQGTSDSFPAAPEPGENEVLGKDQTQRPIEDVALPEATDAELAAKAAADQNQATESAEEPKPENEPAKVEDVAPAPIKDETASQTNPEEDDQKEAREAGIAVGQKFEVETSPGKTSIVEVASIHGDDIGIKVENLAILPTKLSRLLDRDLFKRVTDSPEDKPDNPQV